MVKLKGKQKVAQRLAKPFILLLMLIIFVLSAKILGVALTGATIMQFDDYEHNIKVNITDSDEYVRAHIVFDENKPRICRDGVLVVTGNKVLKFRTENELHWNGTCLETDVVFDNIIYHLGADETEEPVEENETESEQPLLNESVGNQSIEIIENVTQELQVIVNESNATYPNETLSNEPQSNETENVSFVSASESQNDTTESNQTYTANSSSTNTSTHEMTNTSSGLITGGAVIESPTTNNTITTEQSDENKTVSEQAVEYLIIYTIYYGKIESPVTVEEKTVEVIFSDSNATDNLNITSKNAVSTNLSAPTIYKSSVNSTLQNGTSCIKRIDGTEFKFKADCAKSKVYFEESLGAGGGVAYEVEGKRATWQLRKVEYSAKSKKDTISAVDPGKSPVRYSGTVTSGNLSEPELPKNVTVTTKDVLNSTEVLGDSTNKSNTNESNNTASPIFGNTTEAVSENVIINNTENITNTTGANSLGESVSEVVNSNEGVIGSFGAGESLISGGAVTKTLRRDLEIDDQDTFEARAPVIYEIEDEKELSYKKAFDGVDVRYSYQLTKLKEEIVVDETALTLPKFQPDTLDFAFTLEYDPSLRMIVGGEEYNGDTASTSGKIEFRNEKGTLFYFTPPYATDAAGAKTDVNYSVENTGKNIFLRVSVPYDWISDTNRVYPIIVDPTMSSATYTVSGVVAGGGGKSESSGAGYNLTMTVGQPVIGVTSAATYVAELGFFYSSFDTTGPSVGTPTFNVSQPSPQYSNIQVNSTFSDDLGVASCSLTVSGATTAGPYGMSLFNSTVNYTQGTASGVITDTLNDGAHTVTVSCTDSTSNTGQNSATLTTNTAPTQGTPILNTTDITLNDTSQNLTAYKQSFADSDGDTLTAIYDWRINGTSMAILNMPFDTKNTTSAKDYSTFGNDGTVYNATFNLSAGINSTGAYEYTGDDKIGTGITTTLQRFSIGAWVLPYPSTHTGYIVDKDSYSASATTDFPFALYVSSAATSYSCGIDSGDDFTRDVVVQVNGYSANAWHQVFCDYDGSELKVYVDGALGGSSSTSLTLSSNSREYTIGKAAIELSGGIGNSGFNGTIDNVQIFNRSLSLDQIKAMYNTGTPRYNLTVSNETNTLENWSVAVTPSDGIKDGITKISNNVSIRDILPPTVTVDNVTSVERDVVVNSTEPAFVNETLQFNVTINDTESPVDSVWLIIWENAIGGAIKLKTFFSNILGNLWGVTVQTDDTFTKSSYNYSIFANDTSNNTVQFNDTFALNHRPTSSTPILNTTDLTINDSSTNLTAYNQSFADSDGDTLTAIYDWRLNGTSIALLNMPFNTKNATGVKDYSTFGNSGSVINATWMNASQCLGESNTTGGCYDFDGSLDYINICDDNCIDVENRSFSVSVWVKPAFAYQRSVDGDFNVVARNLADSGVAYTGWKVSFDKWLGWQFQVYNGTAYYANENTDAAAEWTYLVGVRNSTHVALYKNGNQVATSAIPNIVNVSSGTYKKIRIGDVGYYTEGGFFNGSIDQVQIFNRSLSANQISAMYNSSRPRYDLIVSDETVHGNNWSVAVTPNDGRQDGITKISNNVTIKIVKSIAIGISKVLSGGINWSITNLSKTEDFNATGNNNGALSDFNISISSEGTNVDVYLKANRNLTRGGGTEIIDLTNQKFTNSTTDRSIANGVKASITKVFTDNKIGTSLANGADVFLKFFLAVPGSTGAGSYTNNVTIKAIEVGETP